MGNGEKPFTLTEHLTANFYTWEKRGRGWQVWDFPVQVEPPFEPFFHSAPQGHVIDDGRKPTVLSSIFGKLKSKPSHTENVLPPLTDIDPLPFIDSSVIKEISLSLPPTHKISAETVEHFLLNLSNCSSPLSFEIIGSKDSIIIQFTCRESDSSQLKQQLKAYFPDITLNEDEVLEKLWDHERKTVVVDFGLSQEFMRTLKTFRNFDTDPMAGIIGALEELEEDEVGIFQVLFQAAREPWQESILRSVTDWQGNGFFIDSPDMANLAKEKVKRPLFGAVIRVAGQSPDSERAWSIVRALGSGLTQMTLPHSNELIPLTNDDYDDFIHSEDVLSRQTHRSGMLLNSEELLSLVHPPSASVKSKKLVRAFKKTKPCLALATGHKLILGENIHQGKRTPVSLSPEQRLRHMYVIGATGTGKSTLLFNLINQDIQSGSGIAVLDPHGDLIEKILGSVPENRVDDVILIDPSDTDHPVGLNILSCHSEIERNVLASDLVSVFKRLSTSWGDQMNSVLSNAVLAFLESEQGGSLTDLRRFLIEETYRREFLKTIKDQEVMYYWQKEFPMLKGNPQSAILTRLDTFLRPKLIRNMVAQKRGLNFDEILNSGKIFLVKLAQGLIGEENAYLLGTLIVSKLHLAAMARQGQSVSQRKNFYLYLDEFHNFVTPSMAAILSGARKYHLGLILAHQELRQLWDKDTQVANSVISNPGTRVCFRLGDFDAKKLEDGFSFFEARDLQNLGTGEAIARIERSENDFNLTTFLAPEIDQDEAKKKREGIIALSRKKYSVSIEEVKKDMEEGLKIVKPAAPSSEKEVTLSKKINTSTHDEEVLSEDESHVLEFISQNPGMFVTSVYKSLKLSGYKGDRIKESLIEKGVIIQEETRQGSGGRLAKVLKATDKGVSALKAVPPSQIKGKGGDLHKHLQASLKEQAEILGWKAVIEKRIPGSLEAVDIELQKGDLKVAVEISSTTKPIQEIRNIRKCLEAGYEYIVCVSPEDKRLANLKTQSGKAFTFRERERFRFCSPKRLKNILESLSPSGIDSGNRIVSEKIPPQKQLLDTKEASELLGIKKNTLYEWVIQRRIPFVKVGRLTKFRRDSLEEWLKKRSQKEETF